MRDFLQACYDYPWTTFLVVFGIMWAINDGLIPLAKVIFQRERDSK